MNDDKFISVSLDDIMPIMEEQLKNGGSVTFGPKGISMLPLIRQNVDSVIISPCDGKLKKYDVPLYKRTDGHYVLHRIVGVCGEEYVMCGDNQYILEKGIKHEQIIGIMSAVIKPDRKINVTDKRYKIYCRRRVLLQRFKRYVHAAARRIKAIFKK